MTRAPLVSHLMGVSLIGVLIAVLITVFMGFAERSVAQPRAVMSSQATDACGADRRCRLERLKERRREREHRRLKRADRVSRELVSLERPRASSRLPRYRYAWGLDLSTSDDSSIGVNGRYSFTEHWQLNVNVSATDLSNIYDLQGRQLGLDMIDPIPSAALELDYFTRTNSLSPFVGFGVRWMKGLAYLSDSDAPQDVGLLGAAANLLGDLVDLPTGSAGPVNAEGELEAHIFYVTAGLDYQQMRTPFHLRLALNYGYPLFVGHRDQGNKQNLPTRASALDFMSERLAWTLHFLIGWSL